MAEPLRVQSTTSPTVFEQMKGLMQGTSRPNLANNTPGRAIYQVRALDHHQTFLRPSCRLNSNGNDSSGFDIDVPIGPCPTDDFICAFNNRSQGYYEYTLGSIIEQRNSKAVSSYRIQFFYHEPFRSASECTYEVNAVQETLSCKPEEEQYAKPEIAKARAAILQGLKEYHSYATSSAECMP